MLRRKKTGDGYIKRKNEEVYNLYKIFWGYSEWEDWNDSGSRKMSEEKAVKRITWIGLDCRRKEKNMDIYIYIHVYTCMYTVLYIDFIFFPISGIKMQE